jgi:hypothetical protein
MTVIARPDEPAPKGSQHARIQPRAPHQRPWRALTRLRAVRLPRRFVAA